MDLTDEIEKEGLSDFWNKCHEAKLSVNDYATALETQFLRIWLNGYVFENNDIAHNCYKRIGFIDKEITANEPFNVIEMEMTREEYYQ